MRVIKLLLFFIGLTVSVSSQQGISFVKDIYPHNKSMGLLFDNIIYDSSCCNLYKIEVVYKKKKYDFYSCNTDATGKAFSQKYYHATKNNSIESEYTFVYSDQGKLMTMKALRGMSKEQFNLEYYKDSIVVNSSGNNKRDSRMVLWIIEGRINTSTRTLPDNSIIDKCKFEYDNRQQLVKINYSDTTEINYRFDEKGNLLQDLYFSYEYYDNGNIRTIKSMDYVYNKKIKDVQETLKIETYMYSEQGYIDKIEVNYIGYEEHNYYIKYERESSQKELRKLYNQKTGKLVSYKIYHYR